MLIAPEVTTDTKIIPLQIEKYLLAGHDLTESFRRAVGDFEGSHAIAMVSNVEPGKIFLALKGSGQSIYVGITPDRYLFSSELYGLVEETPFFVKMDGEKPARPDRPEATGQIFILDQDAPGGAAGIRGLFYDGTPLPLGEGRPEGRRSRRGISTGATIPITSSRRSPNRPSPSGRPCAANTGSSGTGGRNRSSSISATTSFPKGSGRPCAAARSGGSSSSVTGRRPSPGAPWPTRWRAVSGEAGSGWRPGSPPN